MNKENKYCYAMAFPAWIARFVPHMHLTPQGLVVKPGKNDRLIFDASIKIKWDSYNINMATDNSTAPKIYYGEKFAMHLKRIGIYVFPFRYYRYSYGMMTSQVRFVKESITPK